MIRWNRPFRGQNISKCGKYSYIPNKLTGKEVQYWGYERNTRIAGPCKTQALVKAQIETNLSKKTLVNE